MGSRAELGPDPAGVSDSPGAAPNPSARGLRAIPVTWNGMEDFTGTEANSY